MLSPTNIAMVKKFYANVMYERRGSIHTIAMCWQEDPF